MGTRAQVLVKDTGVYLYQHWDGYDLFKTVKEAIARRLRWSDPAYLSRIIFDEMTRECHGEEAGFGIDAVQHWDIEYLVIVDCAEQTVTEQRYDGCGGARGTPTTIAFAQCLAGEKCQNI